MMAVNIYAIKLHSGFGMKVELLTSSSVGDTFDLFFILFEFFFGGSMNASLT